MESNAPFLNNFVRYYGKPFEVVSGRNAYTLDKDRHAQMLKEDGIYLLLENPPHDLKYRYDKALFIPARTADKFFPTNDPSKVKYSFSLAADKMRFEFSQQTHKLYQMPSCIIKTVQFKDTRKDYRIDRKEYDYLIKNKGMFIFVYQVRDKPGILIQYEALPAESITGFKDNNKSTLTLHFELSAYTLKLINDLKLREHLTDERIVNNINVPETKTITTQSKITHIDTKSMYAAVDEYMKNGFPIQIVFPEGTTELVLECTITKQTRRVKE